MRVQVDESISAVWGGRPGGVVAEAGAQSESHCPAFGRGVGGVEAKVSAVRACQTRGDTPGAARQTRAGGEHGRGDSGAARAGQEAAIAAFGRTDRAWSFRSGGGPGSGGPRRTKREAGWGQKTIVF